MTETPIRIALVVGTVRPGNFTGKALALVADELAKAPDVEVDVIDPAQLKLALPGAPGGDDAAALQERIGAATGVVLATPEYHGTFSATLKLVVENLGFPSVLAGKPVALLGVAAGVIGAIKSLEHVRSMASHVGAIVLPGPVSVAGVQGLFDESGACTDAGTEARVRGVGTALLEYIHDNLCPKATLERMAREANDAG